MRYLTRYTPINNAINDLGTPRRDYSDCDEDLNLVGAIEALEDMIKFADESGIQTESAKDKLGKVRDTYYSSKRMTRSMMREEAACLFWYHNYLLDKIIEQEKK